MPAASCASSTALDEYEPEPLPINVIYPQSRLQSFKVRAFVDACVAGLRQARFD